VRQILFRIPLPGTESALTLYGYGAMMCLGFLAAILLAAWRAKREKQSPDVIYNAALVAFFGGILGARAFYVIQNRDHFTGLLDLVTIWEGGLTFYGGFLLAVLAMLAFLAVTKRPILFWLDIMAPSTALGLAFGRMGCFLNGCCYGGTCSSELGMTWPAGTIAWEHYAGQFLASLGLASDLPSGPASGMVNGALAAVWHPPAIHATEIYALVTALLLAILLHTMFRWKRRHGQIILLFAVLYGFGRFFEEMLRADEPPIYLFGLRTLLRMLGMSSTADTLPGLTISENLAALMIVGGIVALLFLMRSRRRTLQADYFPAEVQPTTPNPAKLNSKRRKGKHS
jgi:phosphatidylglycerol---prolipoprotein diacylglyceryl transferase